MKIKFCIGDKAKLKEFDKISKKELSRCDACEPMWRYGRDVTIRGYYPCGDGNNMRYSIEEDGGSSYYDEALFEYDEALERDKLAIIKEEYIALMG